MRTLRHLNTALIQPDTRWNERAANRDHLAGLMDRAGDVDLFVLPETCTTGFLGDLDDPDADGQDDVDWVHDQAMQRRAAVAAGVAVVERGRRYNRLVFATPEGVSTHYNKRHLFSFGGEDERYTAGTRRSRLSWRGWRFDLQICYDLRFPVWCRNDDDFDVQLFIANWPSRRVEAWRSLLQARAIENQAIVIGVNRSGVDGRNIHYPGASCVFDAAGRSLLELGKDEQVATLGLDRDALVQLREELPFLVDRDAYRIV
ncbi:amidohydrolase [Wenzhouxiangella sp. XN79A]|uniref:nitrilase-related carbon-nitrogen hydrolase n=1 Tax=Wenzhouxiangella sp. XN79A TaxID=2724193 RepID=UPI00144A69B0|nr:nitrilase-related carbon-nitrogen hydrolase [Wenzhouxiangella sp. XN79A]NKI33588.1 amidohydrolase [Wenzhouxiangella sp. XN79A]